MVKFAEASDVHFTDRADVGNRYYSKIPTIFPAAISAFNTAAVDRIVLFGDLTDGQVDLDDTEQAIVDLLEDLELADAPVELVLGNHDVMQLTKADALVAFETGRSTFGYTFEIGGRVFIVMDTIFNSDGTDYELGNLLGGWLVPASTISWLDTQLAAAGVKPVYILLHIPIHGHPSYDIANPLAVRAKLEEYQSIVRAVFCGHRHGNASLRYNGIEYVTFESIVEGASPQTAYAIIDLDNDDVIVITGEGNQNSDSVVRHKIDRFDNFEDDSIAARWNEYPSTGSIVETGGKIELQMASGGDYVSILDQNVITRVVGRVVRFDIDVESWGVNRFLFSLVPVASDPKDQVHQTGVISVRLYGGKLEIWDDGVKTILTDSLIGLAAEDRNGPYRLEIEFTATGFDVHLKLANKWATNTEEYIPKTGGGDALYSGGVTLVGVTNWYAAVTTIRYNASTNKVLTDNYNVENALPAQPTTPADFALSDVGDGSSLTASWSNAGSYSPGDKMLIFNNATKALLASLDADAGSGLVTGLTVDTEYTMLAAADDGDRWSEDSGTDTATPTLSGAPGFNKFRTNCFGNRGLVPQTLG